MKKKILLTILITQTLLFCSFNSIAKKKVVLIGVDNSQFEQLPKSPQISKNFTIIKSLTEVSDEPSQSGPNWATVLTGVSSDSHQITNNGPHAVNPQHDSMFKVLSNGGNSIGALTHWENLMLDYFQEDSALLKFNYISAKFDDEHSPNIDSKIEDIISQFEKTSSEDMPDFVLLQLDDSSEIDDNQKIFTQESKQPTNFHHYFNRVIQTTEQDTNNEWLILAITTKNKSIESTDNNKKETIGIIANKKLTKVVVKHTDIAPTIYDYLEVDASNLKLEGKSILDDSTERDEEELTKIDTVDTDTSASNATDTTESKAEQSANGDDNNIPEETKNSEEKNIDQQDANKEEEPKKIDTVDAAADTVTDTTESKAEQSANGDDINIPEETKNSEEKNIDQQDANKEEEPKKIDTVNAETIADTATDTTESKTEQSADSNDNNTPEKVKVSVDENTEKTNDNQNDENEYSSKQNFDETDTNISPESVETD